ncbi:MAG: NUDIX domain-containing protein [Acidobacteriota bacterium]
MIDGAPDARAAPTVDLIAVILAVTDEQPRVLTVRVPAAERPDVHRDALPAGPLDPAHDRTLELALRRWVREQTGLELGYVEQLYTFGDRDRGGDDDGATARALSIGYLALVREEQPPASAARWRPWYEHFPWEDWRRGRPSVLEAAIEPALDAWLARCDAGQRERADIAFGLRGAAWDAYRVLDRYELLYEAGLVAESQRDDASASDPHRVGRAMAADHRRILATAIGRVRGKLKYRPVIFELVPPTFTLLQLQRVVEALSGGALHKQNFRRLIERGGLVEGTGVRATTRGGRPPELFRFRREVLRERPTPGVTLPSIRR